jgi:hypothetical protein
MPRDVQGTPPRRDRDCGGRVLRLCGHFAIGDRGDRRAAAAAQAAYGNVNLGEGLLIGVPGAVGVVAGTANVVPERALPVAAVQLWLAWQLARQVGLPSRLAKR